MTNSERSVKRWPGWQWTQIALGSALIMILLYVLYLTFKGSPLRGVPFNCETCETAKNCCGPNYRQGIWLNGHIVASDIVSIEFDTPLNNQPAKYGNWLGIWEGNSIETGTCIYKIKIQLNSRSGSVALNKKALKVGRNYIIGYAVGDGTESIGATLFLPWQNEAFTPGKLNMSQIWPTVIDRDHVVLRYVTPLGNNPGANQNWVGIQKGRNFTYEHNRFQRFKVNSSQHEGSVAINHYPIACDEWYTLVYGMGRKKKNIVASWTFHGSEAYRSRKLPGPCPNESKGDCTRCTARNHPDHPENTSFWP